MAGADGRVHAHDFYDPKERYFISAYLVDATGVDTPYIMRGATIFAVLGYDPLESLHQFFIAPLSRPDQVADLFVKACPLIITATGLFFVTEPMSGISVQRGRL